MKKLKIAFIIGPFPSLSETFILNQMTGLIDRGHSVDIYASKPKSVGKMHGEVTAYRLLDSCYYDGMPGSMAGRYAEAVKIIARKPKLLKLLNVFKYGMEALTLKSLFMADKIRRDRKYDVVYCHFGNLGKIGAILKEAGILDAKVVTTFHGRDVSAYIEKWGKHAYDVLFKHGDLFLPISDNWKSKLIELGCDESRTAVHRMGIDTAKFSFIPRTAEPDGRVKLVTVARLVEKKGVEYGIRGVAEALKQYPNLEYTVIGDGPLMERLQSLAGELGVQDRVRLVGGKEQSEVIRLLNDAHMMLAPSVTAADGDQEGIPVVLMEALSMGLPVISTLHSGIPEVIEDGVSGHLVPERDVKQLADKIVMMARNPERWAEMGRQGRISVERNYDIESLNDKLVRLFRTVSDHEASVRKDEYRFEYTHN